MKLQGKTALITGAAKRIGRETALALADIGANVVIHFNRSDSEARGVAEELQLKGVKAWTIQADFRRPNEYQTLIERALQTAGGLDILINNASIFPSEKLKDLTWSELSANIEVNSWVPFVLETPYWTVMSRRDAQSMPPNTMPSVRTGANQINGGQTLGSCVMRSSTIQFTNTVAPWARTIDTFRRCSRPTIHPLKIPTTQAPSVANAP